MTERGPAAVRAGLIEAALDLFASQGGGSIREVAHRAGVNHGLVHHYLGSKANLRRAVLDRALDRIYRDLEVPQGSSMEVVAAAVWQQTRADPRFVKVLARALLDDDPAALKQEGFPVVSRLREASQACPEETDANIAAGLALAMGGLVFGPWIRAALDMSRGRFDELSLIHI